MTFRATNQHLADGLSAAKREAVNLVNLATDTRNAMAAGNTSANLALQLLQRTREAIAKWTAIKAIPGMAQYARDQENDQAYDVVAEFNAMQAAAEALRDRIISDLPKDAQGWALLVKHEAAGDTVRTFTPAQTAALRTDIDAFLATIS